VRLLWRLLLPIHDDEDVVLFRLLQPASACVPVGRGPLSNEAKRKRLVGSETATTKPQGKTRWAEKIRSEADPQTKKGKKALLSAASLGFSLREEGVGIAFRLLIYEID